MNDGVQHERELRELWQEAHTREHKLEREALMLARRDIDRRLEEMNQFREQIANERGEFVSRETYDAQHLRLAEAVDTARNTIDARLKILETGKSNLEGRIWMMGAAISGAVVLLNLAIRFWK